MTSPYRVLQVARDILNDRPFCKYTDSRYHGICGYARTSTGNRTDPVNRTATQFTIMGAVARASAQLADGWIDGHGGACFDSAMKMLQKRVNKRDYEFFSHCDKIGKSGCIKLIEEVLDFDNPR